MLISVYFYSIRPVDNNSINDDISTQSKVKESKVKESKVNAPEINQPSLDQIQSISEEESLHNAKLKSKFKEYSELYPKKTKKIQAFEALKKLSDQEIEKLMIGAKNVSVIANTLGPEDYNYLKNQETFIIDSEYLNYQSLPRPKNEAPVGSKTPEWHVPNYKNETTAEQQTELERIRQESLKNLRQ